MEGREINYIPLGRDPAAAAAASSSKTLLPARVPQPSVKPRTPLKSKDKSFVDISSVCSLFGLFYQLVFRSFDTMIDRLID